jgi:hypothetical protein
MLSCVDIIQECRRSSSFKCCRFPGLCETEPAISCRGHLSFCFHITKIRTLPANISYILLRGYIIRYHRRKYWHVSAKSQSVCRTPWLCHITYNQASICLEVLGWLQTFRFAFLGWVLTQQ